MPKSIDPRELFRRVKELWPLSVEFGDDPQEALNAIYWPLEERLGHDDEWLSLGAWAFHQSTSKFEADESRSTLDIKQVPFETFDHYMRMNLEDPSWDEWRPLYEGSTS